MISLGGTIGTDLFLASGGAIHNAGPGGALTAYVAIGVYFLMTGLALRLIGNYKHFAHYKYSASAF
jgi:amino acid permease